jgi:hypothetical protein
VWAIAHHARASGAPRAYLRDAAGTTALAGGLFVAIVAAQFLSTSALIGHTVREERDLAFIGTTAFTGDDLMAFVVPKMPMPSEGPYITILFALCVGVALSLRPDARKLTLAGVAVLGVLCSWGDLGPFLPFSASVATPFGFFRRAHRYLYVTMVPLAILGAEGLAELARLEAQELRKKVLRVLLAAGAVGLVIFGCGFVVEVAKAKRSEPYLFAFGVGFASVAVSVWVLAMIVAKDGRWRQVFLGLAALVVVSDIWFTRADKVERNMWPLPEHKRDREVRQLEGVPLEARVYDREVLKYRPGIRLDIRDLGGYEGDPLALSRYAKFLAMARGNTTLLGHGNIRYLLEGGQTRTKPEVWDTSRMTQARPGMFQLPAWAPPVMWVEKAQVVDGVDKAFAALRGATPGAVAVLEKDSLPPGSEAWIGAAPGAPAGGAAASGAAPVVGATPVAGRFTRFGRSSLTAEIDAPARGVVVINEAYYPGWQATVDGKPAKVLPANGLFRAVLVEPGHHVIAMTYPATGYKVLSVVCLLGLLAATGLLVLELRRRA